MASPAISLADGEVIAWGLCDPEGNDMCDVPEPNTGFVAVAVAAGNGPYASWMFWGHGLGVKEDGSIVAWVGYPPPEPNTDFVAVDAGMVPYMGGHSLGLKADGSIVAWDYSGQTAVPEPNTDFVGVAAAGGRNFGIKADGTIVSWGCCGAPGAPPEPNTGFVAMAVSGDFTSPYGDPCGHALGLKADGSIVAWGCNDNGQCDVPAPNTDFIAVAAGGGFGAGQFSPWVGHSLGLLESGEIETWGDNSYGQCDVPAPNCDFIAIAANAWQSFGLKRDGAIVAWGYLVAPVPEPNNNFVYIAAGGAVGLGIKGDAPVPVLLSGFAAQAQQRQVLLTWHTSFEHMHDGFNVYRSPLLTSGYARLNDRLVRGRSPYSYLDTAVEPSTTYFYKLGAVDLDGHEMLHDPISVSTPAWGMRTELSLASPSPFRKETVLSFTLATPAEATLAVYDVAGRLVRVLVDDELPVSDYDATWDGRDDGGMRVAGGTYFVKLTAGDVTQTRKVVYLGGK